MYTALPSPEEAAAHDYSDAEHAVVARLRQRAFYGTGPRVARMLHELSAEQGVDEIAVLTTVHDQGARRRSYSLLAQASGAAQEAAALAAE